MCTSGGQNVPRPRMRSLTLPPHVHMVRAGGREYFYYHPYRGTKRAGTREKLPGCPQNPDGSLNAEWWATYRRLNNDPEPAPRTNTFAALSAAYRASPEWAAVAASTRRDYTRYAAIIENAWGDADVRGVEPLHVLALRDSYADVPPPDPKAYTKPLSEYRDRSGAANGLLRLLSAMLSWGVLRGFRNDNPAKHVPKLEAGGDGYPFWPMRAIEHYRKHGKAHLWWVVAHALYTGQRQSDVLGMMRSHVKDGSISVVQEKTGKRLWIPMHRDLLTIHAQMPRASTHILTNTRGRPWTSDGFRASWQSEMDRRIFRPFGRNGLVFHGLRKSAVVFLIEAGCSPAEVASITGQTMEMVEHYAKQVNQKKLARAAILKWEHAGR